MVTTQITDFVIFGNTTDTKPLAGIPAQTLFFEIDSGNVYKFVGGVWSPFSGAAKPETFTNKTLTTPVISQIKNGTGTLTLPNNTNDTVVCRNTTDTMANKTLTYPTIATINNGGVITLPSGTRTLVARDTNDTLLNKTINTNSNTITATSQATGDILVNNGAQFVRLARGSNGQVLTATATTIQWAAPSGGGGGLSASSPNTFTAVQTFNDTMLALRNPTNTFSATLGAGAQTANRTFTFPVTSGNDTIQTIAAAQTITNKTVNVNSNTFTATSQAVGDLMYNDGTSFTRLPRGTNGQVLTATTTSINWAAATGGGVSTSSANTWTAAQTFNDTMLLLRNPANTFSTTLGSGAQTAARTFTFPVVSGNDTIQTIAATQTVTGKTMSVNSNTITATSQAAGDLLVNDGSSFVRLARGTTGQVLTSTASTLQWSSASSGAMDTTYFTYTYFIYKSGSNYVAQSGSGISPATTTTNASFSTLLNSIITGISPTGTPTLILIGTGTFDIAAQVLIGTSAIGNIVIRGMGMGLTNLNITSAWNGVALDTPAIKIGSVPTVTSGITGTLTANCAIKSGTCTVSTADAAKFAVGDYVLLTSTLAWSTAPSAGSPQAEMKRVINVNTGTGVITFDVPTFDTYNTANTAVIYKLSVMLKNIMIQDLTIQKGSGLNYDTGGTTGVCFFAASCVDNLRIERVQLIDNVSQYTSGMRLLSCINSTVTGCHLLQTAASTYNLQYGLSIEACSQNIIVSNCTAIGRFRHPFEMVSDQTGSGFQGILRNITCTGCTAQGSELAGFDTHTGGELVTFNDCKFLGNAQSTGDTGFQMRTRRTNVIGCTIQATVSYGIEFSGDAHDCIVSGCIVSGCIGDGIRLINDQAGVKRIKVMGNVCYNNHNGINVEPGCDYTSIIGNTVYNNDNEGIWITDSDHCIVTNNTICNNLDFGILVDATNTSLTNCLIRGNDVTGNSSSPPIKLTGSFGGNVIVNENTGADIIIGNVVSDPSLKKTGYLVPTGTGSTTTTVASLGLLLAGSTVVSPGTPSCTFDTTEGIVANMVTTTTTNQNAGLISATTGVGSGRRLFGMRVKIRSKVDTVASSVSRLYVGYTSATALPISDTPLATTDSGVIVGFSSADTTYQIYYHDGSGTVTKTAITGSISKNTNFHTIEIIWIANGNISIVFDGVAQTITTDLPLTTSNLFFNAVAQNATAAARTHTIKGIWMEIDK